MDDYSSDQLCLSLSHSISGVIDIPGDKSISHRAVILGAIAEGDTIINGFLRSEDCLNTLSIIKQLGVKVSEHKNQLTIHGVGVNGLRKSKKPLYCGNSGTAMRLLSGLLSAQKFSSILTGDESLSARPMRRVVEPLRRMGAVINTNNYRAPLSLNAVKQLNGIDHVSQVASAQVKSCLLLAGIYANGTTCISEPNQSRNHTELMLAGFGYEIEQGTDKSLKIIGGGSLSAQNIDVPSDISSAAFFMILAICNVNSQLTIKQVCINPTRFGVIKILQLMGAKIDIVNSRTVAGELLADIIVYSSVLKGIEIPSDLIPSAIDEFPILFIAAACAQGVTVLRGADELRHKESDRITVMINGLKKMGIQCKEEQDGVIIHGGKFRSAQVDADDDHRCAMSFLIAGCLSKQKIDVVGCQNIATSFPEFLNLCAKLGVDVER